MEQTTIESTTSLEIVRTYQATREAIFEALTKPYLLSRWFAPSEEFEAYVDRFEANVGGSYRIEMRQEGGNVHTAIGTIKEFDPPEKLAYTWRWEGGEMGDTLVTWMLKEVEDGTELTLHHEQFPNEEARDHHHHGWTGIMSRLQPLFARGAARFLELGLELNGRLFHNALDGVSDEHFSARLNDRTNSMLWVAGHLAQTRSNLAKLVDASVDVDLSMFDDPIDDRADYPGKQAIIEAWNAVSEALYVRLGDVTAAELARPAPMRFPVSEQTIGGGVAFLTEHEGYHIGQLGFLRKAHGYEAVVYP